MTIAIPAAAPLLAALNQALRGGRRPDVDRAIAALLRAAPPIGAQWRLVAQVSRRNGALGHARAAMRLLVAQSAGNPGARFEEAALLADTGDLAGAEAALAALPAGFPDPATRAHFAATLALNRGDLDAARDGFRRAIAARPTSGASWLSLADASRGLPPADWAPAVIAAAPAFAMAGEAERAAYGYALGAAHDALGEHDPAFAAFAGAAALVRTGRPYDAAADEAAAGQAMRAQPVAARPTIATVRPIFVFGPPRSGTTLVEQILASHSAVAGGGEVQLFDLVAERIGGLSGAALARAVAIEGVDALAADYLALLSERFGREGRIVDKTLTTSRMLGLIPTVLPDAPLVWVHRNPLDTAWSCFRTLFTQGVPWSFDQTDIARHLLIEDQLRRFWQRELGERLLVLDYRDLVTDPAATIPRLLAHCGLAPEPAVFAPHETRRAVTTASVTQVRAPINARAVGAAAPYRRHLAPFVEAYTAGGGRLDG